MNLLIKDKNSFLIPREEIIIKNFNIRIIDFEYETQIQNILDEINKNKGDVICTSSNIKLHSKIKIDYFTDINEFYSYKIRNINSI